MNTKKPLASLSLDLDNKWSYMKTHGDAGWEAFPSYLDVVVPRFLDFLETRHLTITVFIVGQDAALEKNHTALKQIAQAGHEVGNHSFNHEPWLHLYSEAEIETEIEKAEKAIAQATGKTPIGFRGPGFSCSPTVLKILQRRGYLYDASTFPTFLGPLARAYYFMTSNLSKEDLDQRKALFGKFEEGFRPLNPYQWRLDETRLIEIPVTTMPLFKIPIHFSYLLYLSVFSPPLAKLYFNLALTLCRLTKTQPSLLLHPLDFLGTEDAPELAFFPAMNLPSYKKLAYLSYFVGALGDRFTLVPLHQQAQTLAQSSLKTFKPRFALS